MAQIGSHEDLMAEGAPCAELYGIQATGLPLRPTEEVDRRRRPPLFQLRTRFSVKLSKKPIRFVKCCSSTSSRARARRDLLRLL